MLIRGAEDPEGLTFNWVNGKFYYAETNRIYSADEDGDYVQKVFESKLCGLTLLSEWLHFRRFLGDFEFCA